MALVASSQVASAAPKDKVEVLDGAALSPEKCSDAACGDDDISIDPSDHSAGFNAPQIAATRASVAWGSAGAVANPAGRLKAGRGPGRR